MPYIVNETSDELALRAPVNRRLAAGARCDVTPEQADALAGHACFGMYEDDGSAYDAPAPDWSPKRLVLAPEFLAGEGAVGLQEATEPQTGTVAASTDAAPDDGTENGDTK